MKYLRRSLAGKKVSAIGLGTWPLGGEAYGRVSASVAAAVVRKALSSGVSLVDTADIYGDGAVEGLLGRVLRNREESVVVVTKAGYVDYLAREQRFDLVYLRGAVEGSLERLRLDQVDVVLLHSPPRDEIVAGLQALLCLKRIGLCRAIGVSVRQAEDGFAALETGECEVLEVAYSVVDLSARTSGLLAAAAAASALVLAKAPLSFGLLSAKYHSQHRFEPPDHRSRISGFQLDKRIRAARRWAKKSSEGGASPAQRALQFCICAPGSVVPIPGAKTVSQLQELLVTADLPLMDRRAVETGDKWANAW